jgi:hypothetical protein
MIRSAHVGLEGGFACIGGLRGFSLESGQAGLGSGELVLLGLQAARHDAT